VFDRWEGNYEWILTFARYLRALVLADRLRFKISGWNCTEGEEVRIINQVEEAEREVKFIFTKEEWAAIYSLDYVEILDVPRT